MTPRPRAVVIGSLSLFAVLFVFLAIQLSTSSSSATADHHRAMPAIVESQAEPESEPEEVEPEYVEPEVEEIPPVVTSSS